MTWTCDQTEARLSDYLDGLLQPAEQAAFDLHVNACERCTPLVADVSHVLGALHKLEQVEPPARLANSILTFSWRKPKLADLAPATIYHNADRQAHLIYARSTKFVSDLRVVYEIQSRMNENEQNPTSREESVPQTSPRKDPGQTDNSNPSVPRQQNRANEIGRNLQLLAAYLSVPSILRWTLSGTAAIAERPCVRRACVPCGTFSTAKIA